MLKDKKVEVDKSRKQVVYAFNARNFSYVLRYRFCMDGLKIKANS